MTFNKCSVRGKLYGYVYDEAGNEVTDVEVKKKSDRNDDVVRDDEYNLEIKSH